MTFDKLKQMIEEKEHEAHVAEWNDAPFPMDEYESAIWHRGRREILTWILEMWPNEVRD